MYSFESLDTDFDIYGIENNKKKYNYTFDDGLDEFVSMSSNYQSSKTTDAKILKSVITEDKTINDDDLIDFTVCTNRQNKTKIEDEIKTQDEIKTTAKKTDVNKICENLFNNLHKFNELSKIPQYMEKYKKYYDILNLECGSDINLITKTYRKLALKYHPDKNHDYDTTDKYVSIVDAYKELVKLYE